MRVAQLPDPAYQPEFYDAVTVKRGMAWIIDTLIITLLCVLIIPFTAFTAIFFLPFLFLVVGFAYRTITLATSAGTWGMRMMALELRDAQGARPGLATAALHTLGYTLSISTILVQVASIVLMCTTERGQSLTDLILGTVMLNRRA